MGRYRVTVDTGGTFSDFVYLDEDTDEITVAKIPSTPDDPSRAILAGIEQLIEKGVLPIDIRYFCHGTTVGTNALLEGKGVRTGLLVTQGFRGIYEVQEQSRPHGPTIFDIMYDKPALLAPASQTGEVRERIASNGEMLIPLDEAQIRTEARRLGKSGVESIAVCLLFSFLRPDHEARVRAIIEEEIPGCSVSLSSEIVPQIREYYRLSTTVINAYLQPILARYIANLDRRLSGVGVATPQKYIMQSNGGMSTFTATAKKAVATVLSGPAGGVTASMQACRTTGFLNLITFDMGGTSCDVALIKDGEPSLSNRGKIEGRDIALPMIDINTVSAGGGTLARVDRFGTLEVGPESAGAQPGPACYGRGGEQPTITDCNLVLGYLSPDNFLGGQMTLDRVRAHLAVETHVAKQLDMDAPKAAEGIVRIINVKMQEAIKAISTMRGHDLRDFMLLAFGGAGPLHAGRIAADLGMAGVIVPPFPGVYSAMGLVMSDVKHDYIRSRLSPLADVTESQINTIFDDLARQAREDLAAEHFAEPQTCIEPALDMRYAGQGYEITVPCDAVLKPGAIKALRQHFDRLHKESFGHTAPDEPVEIVSYRLRGVGLVPPVKIPKFAPSGTKLADALRETRKAQFDGKIVDCPVYQREKLDVGANFIGPAIIDQLDCTTVLFPGHTARVDAYRNIIMTVQEA
ncbi:hydantoinase/oxoprolinase family protein [Methylocella sp. CPCC 101449]|uniref:hydantoinase/oxoprolinase family protein n=1 Tax=Methylocella sp. CPCC 101449 TaxID=2987531 RepID=UPI00289081BD|nr:hydantoinase/oxoprolinase family protein [Methylocella sp. CPCC 101449]MDT2023214.1 hydantoinase/oxoprolinase family protein [Methylocella sp. CPCC 101449]